VLLAGILLKTGAYGLIRFLVPLFPGAAAQFRPLAMTLAVIGILYGAVLAFGQTDFKRLVAYSSVSHMGFVLLGVFAWNEIALQGVTLQMIAHGLSTGGLFVVAGALQERLHTRDMRRMGGLWAPLPRLGAVTLIFAIGSLGLPGLGNFVGEFLVLLGTFADERGYAVLAALGLVAAAVYSLVLVQRAFHGALPGEPPAVRDFGAREMTYAAAMIAALVVLGVRPQPAIDTAAPAIAGLLERTSLPDAVASRGALR
jgi:NADH-quinone oxidoreductase subunit M